MTLLTDTLQTFTKAELIDFINEYDQYIIQYIEDHGVCEDGCAPACASEFNDCEYQDILESREG